MRLIKRFGLLRCMVVLLASLFWADLNSVQAIAEHPDFSISNPISRAAQTITGVRFVTRKVAEHIIAKQLTSTFQKRPHVHLYLYSVGDLAAGKFRGMDITGHHLLLGVPFSDLTLSVHQPVWIKLESKPKLQTPVVASMVGTLSESDVNAMLAAQKRLTTFKVKLPAFGEQTLVALAPHVTMLENRLQLSTTLSIPGASLDTALPLEVEGQLVPNAEHNRLVWKNLTLQSAALHTPELLAAFIEDQFGKAISFASRQVNGHPMRVELMNSDIHDHNWTITARVTVLPYRP